jgi:tetratricopeptide (TPR) repeat protein
VDAFEKAHRLDPESARDGLVAAHRDLGTALENEGQLDQARPHFQRVMDIIPNDAAARIKMRDTWRATAGAHLATGRWEKAIEAYREALRYVPEDESLQQTVVTLEQRYLDAGSAHRRRQQLQRAVLEARLKEEQTRREQLEARMAQSLPVMLAVSAGAVLAGVLIVAAHAGKLADGLWAMVVGASLIALYATYTWATRKLA